ncbi:hypothetical protein INT43_003022, partial [Umbelopsis isabellina]
MQHVNGVPVYNSDPNVLYDGLKNCKPTWYSAQGGVYRCRQQMHPNTLIAIKKYYVEECYEDPDAFIMPRDLVENEIYAMTLCAPHVNVLKLHSVHLFQECIYLIMPLCTGGSLQEYVFQNRVSVGQMVYILQGLVNGLHEIHRHGYIHRDIKCDNIFLTKETNEIVIGDFGVVSIKATADSVAEEAGVVLFWAPESIEGRIVDNKIDIWALGIVIMEILNGGKAPYEDEECSEETIKEIILATGRPKYPDGLPPLLVDFMDRCLEVDSQHRASTDELLQHPFLTECESEYLFPSYPLHNHDVDDYSSTMSEDMVVPVADSDIILEQPNMDDIMSGTTADQAFITENEEAGMLRIKDRLRTLELLTEKESSKVDRPVDPHTTNYPSEQPLEVDHDTIAIPSIIDKSNQHSIPEEDDQPPPQQLQTHIPRKRSYLARSSILLSGVDNVQGGAMHRLKELKDIHPVQQAYDVFHRRTFMCKNYRDQGSRLPLFIAAVTPKEQLPTAPVSPPKAKEIKRVKSMMVSPKEERKSSANVRRAYSVANFSDKENKPIVRSGTTLQAHPPTVVKPQTKRISQIDPRKSLASTTRNNQKAAESDTKVPEKTLRRVSTSVDVRSHKSAANTKSSDTKLYKSTSGIDNRDTRARKLTSNVDNKDTARARRTSTNTRAELAKSLKQETRM